MRKKLNLFKSFKVKVYFWSFNLILKSNHISYFFKSSKVNPVSNVLMWVAFKLIFGAFPSFSASPHRMEQRHQKFPAFNPGNSPFAVIKSFPFENVKSKNWKKRIQITDRLNNCWGKIPNVVLLKFDFFFTIKQ